MNNKNFNIGLWIGMVFGFLISSLVWVLILTTAQESEAQTVTLTAEVPLTVENATPDQLIGGLVTRVTVIIPFNNCNIHTTKLEPPVITEISQGEYGFTFTGTINNRPFYTETSEGRMDFYLDSAHWSYTAGDRDVVYDECVI
jgi:hypothetical protein